MIRRTTTLVIAGLACLSSSTFAQMGMGSDQPTLRFSAAPEIGERIPNLTIFDDAGNPVNLREIASENYTVLVLGCLT